MATNTNQKATSAKPATANVVKKGTTAPAGKTTTKAAATAKAATPPKTEEASKINKGAKLMGIDKDRKEVRSSHVHEFIKREAGGQASFVKIVLTKSVDREASRPIPFTNMEKQGKRASIFWAMVNGINAETGEPKKKYGALPEEKVGDMHLDKFLRYAIGEGMSGTRLQDLLAAMNGGFSQSSKSWGTAFVTLEVVG